jgi:hypothetical protein
MQRTLYLPIPKKRGEMFSDDDNPNMKEKHNLIVLSTTTLSKISQVLRNGCTFQIKLTLVLLRTA